jgi:type IV pilus assembly protein PilX
MNVPRHEQRGAALVVGLVLLLILTLLAISGMNTATTELTMAGNEQYQTRAFQAAETGIERAITTAVLNPVDDEETLAAVLDDGDGDADNDDSFDATIVPRGVSMVPNYSLGEFHAEHFEITSDGTSLRNASATHTQGLYLVAPGEAPFLPLGGP